MRLNMHKLKNKFKRLLMSAATIGTACLWQAAVQVRRQELTIPV